ncbi:hypothetical protein SAY87_006686 [Trapa incisa]|uniref:Uncharacterized protein n=1 Tax=Trapa incisa TaxID=236973 RepID=A0AAN7PZX7_9MYRT|nr:hypothetical protein SAY87_006686 [Trapa incisa]
MEKTICSLMALLVIAMTVATQPAAARTVPAATVGLTDQKNFLTYGGVGGYAGLGGPGAGLFAPVYGGVGGLAGINGPGGGGAAIGGVTGPGGGIIGGTTGLPGLGGIGGGAGVLPNP